MDDWQFARLLEFFDYSWKGYRKVRKGVKKRIARHMQELDCRNVDDYLAAIASDAAIRVECERKLTVSISRFFRDIYLWNVMEEKILPGLAEKRRTPPRMWFAGCAAGEEVYSFKILWEELAKKRRGVLAPVIIATDINPEHIKRAETGIYPKGALREVDCARREKWFIHRKNRYEVTPELQKEIDWRVMDLITGYFPETGFDIIFLRNNLLTYYRPGMILKPLERVIDALAPSGFLVTGAKEKLPAGAVYRLTPYDRYVYRKHGNI